MSNLVVETAIGRLRLEEHDGWVVGCRWTDEPAGGPPGTPLLERAADQLREYLEGRRQDFELPLRAAGTPFQRRVWRALEAIPFGTTLSYAELAVAVGCPRAARAVGTANARNPLSVFVPCHRVVRGSGEPGGYAGGAAVKRELLALEAARAAGGAPPAVRPVTEMGIISDTHGLVRPEAVAALAGVDLLIHAGDVGRPEVIPCLEAVAPTVAIRGNVDRWADHLPDTETVAVGGRRIFVIHDVKTLDFDPAAAGIHVVIAGHSHKPLVRRANGVLYLNPGSAGPRRFTLPVAVARLRIGPAGEEVEIVELEVGGRRG